MMCEVPRKERDATESRMSSGRQQGGFTYLGVIFLVAAISAGLGAIAEIWSHARQREKEAELLWVGNEFRHAIGLYYQRTPGAIKRYPERLEDLLSDQRSLSTQRYLRRIYSDPMSGKPSWGLVLAPEGGIRGVHSFSVRQPIKTGGFAKQIRDFDSLRSYSEWRFVYVPTDATTYR